MSAEVTLGDLRERVRRVACFIPEPHAAVFGRAVTDALTAVIPTLQQHCSEGLGRLRLSLVPSVPTITDGASGTVL